VVKWQKVAVKFNFYNFEDSGSDAWNDNFGGHTHTHTPIRLYFATKLLNILA